MSTPSRFSVRSSQTTSLPGEPQTQSVTTDEAEEDKRSSTAARTLIFAVLEITGGLIANGVQMVTTVFSCIQLLLGNDNLVFQRYGAFGGLAYVSVHFPVYLWIAIVTAVGAQLLMQAGCQLLSRSWKKEHVPKEQHAYDVVQILMSQKTGMFFTALGFVLDAGGDVGFVTAFNVPFYICVIFGLIMNGLSTYALYDGDERFQYAYPIYWKMQTARRLWKQATLEKSRLMQGVARNGQSLLPRVYEQ